MLQIDFVSFNVESICGFTSDFVDMCYIYSHPFGSPFRRNHPPLYILNVFVTTLTNQDKNFAFLQVDKDGAISRFSGCIKTCQNMNIIVKTTSEDASSLNGKS